MALDVKRNDLCPCGSQKKYKKCCGEKSLGARTVRPLSREKLSEVSLFQKQDAASMNSLLGRIVTIKK